MKNSNKKESRKTAITYYLKNIKALSLGCIIGFTLLTSCGEDDVADVLGLGCGSNSWEGEIEKATADYSTAYSTYINDPSTANCNNYKTATIKYYEAIEDIYDCIPGVLSSAYDGYINEAKNSLEELNCN